MCIRDRLLRAVDHPNLAAQYDLYHMARQQLDVAAGMRLLAGRIGHVQFADVPGRGAPGSGELDFAPLLETLRESGYDGWLGAEYRPGEAGTQASPVSYTHLRSGSPSRVRNSDE